jgi:hypothetical protein
VAEEEDENTLDKRPGSARNNNSMLNGTLNSNNLNDSRGDGSQNSNEDEDDI